MTFKVRRYISIFNKTDETYVGELAFFAEPSIAFLRSFFPSDDEDDPMYYEYPINELTASQLASLVDGKFDLGRFDYFLSCDRLA